MNDTTPETPTATKVCQYCNDTGWYRNSVVACDCGAETPTDGRDALNISRMKAHYSPDPEIENLCDRMLTLAAQLAQAQGEVERLKAEAFHQDDYELQLDQARAELTAACAECERLRGPDWRDEEIKRFKEEMRLMLEEEREATDRLRAENAEYRYALMTIRDNNVLTELRNMARAALAKHQPNNS